MLEKSRLDLHSLERLGDGLEGGEKAAKARIDEHFVIEWLKANDALGAGFGWQIEPHGTAGGDVHVALERIEERGTHGVA
jgi:hypothetical protein